MDLDRQAGLRTIRAFNKVLWIQNDFINRHYQMDNVADSVSC
jgi:hypothetical protein